MRKIFLPVGKRPYFEDIAFCQMCFLKLSSVISVHFLDVYVFFSYTKSGAKFQLNLTFSLYTTTSTLMHGTPGRDGECIQNCKCIFLLRTVYITTAAPSPPYDITCLESFRDSMVLGWKQPDTTGGAEITGYYVNYREVIGGVPGKWREANIKAVSDAAYKVSKPVSLWWAASCEWDGACVYTPRTC